MITLAEGQLWLSPLGRTYKIIRIMTSGEVLYAGGRGILFVATEVLRLPGSGWTLIEDVGSGVAP